NLIASKMRGMLVRYNGEIYALLPRQRLHSGTTIALGALLHEAMEMQMLARGMDDEESHRWAGAIEGVYLSQGLGAAAQIGSEARSHMPKRIQPVPPFNAIIGAAHDSEDAFVSPRGLVPIYLGMTQLPRNAQGQAVVEIGQIQVVIDAHNRIAYS